MIILTIQLWRGPKTVDEGLEQLSGYLETLGLNEGWLLFICGPLGVAAC